MPSRPHGARLASPLSGRRCLTLDFAHLRGKAREACSRGYFGPTMLQLRSAEGKLAPEATVVSFINHR